MRRDKIAFKKFRQTLGEKSVNTVRCSNCAAENAADLRFCTNCGKPLSPPNFAQAAGQNFGAPQQPRAKSKTGRNAAIVGGLGCLVLLIGIAVVCLILGYFSKNSGDNASLMNLASNERTISNGNSSLTNRGGIKISNSNSVIFGNSDSSASNDNSSLTHPPTDEEFRNFLPSAVGEYERQGETVDGNISEDYPGADKIVKALYVKKGKKVTVILAQFASPATAKQSYGFFLDGFKSVGAKVLLSQKVKNKTGIETGDLSIYSYSGKWETLIYADRFGFRITAPDRVTLGDFLKVFGSYMQLVGDK